MSTLFKGLLTCAVLSVAFAPDGQAATRVAANCSSATVQSVINASADGDTVTVPTGNCTWSTAVTISSKAITLQGAGSGSGGTKISYGGSGHPLFDVNGGNNTGKLDISGFWLSGGDSNYWDGTAMQVYGANG